MPDDTKPSQANETIEQTMARLGGADWTAEPDPEPQEPPVEPPDKEEPQAKEEPKDPEPEPKRKDVTPDDAPVPNELRELARKHGFKIEGKSVVQRDWAKFNAAKKKAQIAMDEREKAIAAKEEQAIAAGKQSAEKVAKAQRVLDLLSSHDFEGLAVEGGLKDFNAVQEVMASKLADPNYLRTKAAKEQAEAAEKRAQEIADKVASEAKEREEAANRRAREQKVEGYKRGLAAEMAESDDPYLKAFHDDPWVVHATYLVQEEHFDPETKTTISAADALDEKVPGTNMTIRESVDYLINRVHKHIAALRPEQREKAEKAVEKAAEELKDNKPVGRTEPNKTPEGAQKKKVSDMSPREQSDYYINAINKAARG
jgi:hypothetical protein